MDSRTTHVTIEPALIRFADRLRQQVGAQRVLLFGSRARGEARSDSDYDVLVVSRQFEGVPLMERGRGLWQIWYQAGGYGPMDIFCLTPEEFETARHRITLVAAVLPESVDLLATDGDGNRRGDGT